ncbi:MAG: hypothetical protein GX037_05355 [Trueperella sp.]|nr:hypothetical protein [Trueperella sp.]
MNLSSLLARLARPVHTSVALMWPEQIPADARDAMDEYASYGEPLEIGGQLAQQSTRETCGAMALLVSRALTDAVFAERVANEGIAVVEHALFAELRRGALGPVGWPHRYGTPPWTLAKAMGPYLQTPVDTTTERGKAIIQWIYHATGMGMPVPLYTGGDLAGGLKRAVPRHVVLAMPGGGLTPEGIPELAIYNPGTGYVYRVPIFAMAERRKPLSAFGHWTHLVWAVLPTSEGVQ